MKNLLAHNKTILVVNWNFFLAGQMVRILDSLAKECGASPYSYSVITRNTCASDFPAWQVPTKTIWDFFKVIPPDIVVHDPFGVGEDPSPDAVYEEGMNLAIEFDSSPSHHILWTCLEKERLPELNNTFYIPQGQSLTNVFSTIDQLVSPSI